MFYQTILKLYVIRNIPNNIFLRSISKKHNVKRTFILLCNIILQYDILQYDIYCNMIFGHYMKDHY